MINQANVSWRSLVYRVLISTCRFYTKKKIRKLEGVAKRSTGRAAAVLVVRPLTVCGDPSRKCILKSHSC